MRRVLAGSLCAVMVALIMPLFPAVPNIPTAAADNVEGHEANPDPQAYLGASNSGTVEDDGTGNAHTESVYVPAKSGISPGQLIAGWSFGPGEVLAYTPCVGYGEVAGRVPENICASYDGYTHGFNINNNLENQRVCFSELSEDPQPSKYFIAHNLNDDVVPPMNAMLAFQLGLFYPPPFGEDLGDAIGQYNRDRLYDITGPDLAHESYEVATIPNYSSTGLINLRGGMIEYYDWPYTAYPPDGGNGKVHPTRLRWSKPVMGMQKEDEWEWTWWWRVTIYDTREHCVTDLLPPYTETCWDVRGVALYSYTATTGRSAYNSTPVIKVGSPPEPPGQYPYVYYNAVYERTALYPIPQPRAPRIDVYCDSLSCGSSRFATNITHYPGTPQELDAGPDVAWLPSFWKVYQEFGTSLGPAVQATAEHITQLKNQGINWLDDTRATEYQINYFDCKSARNGRVFKAWKVGVPFPRLAPKPWDFTTADNAVVGDYLLPPNPQSLPGLHTASVPLDPMAAIPVHIPVPLFDIGSGININPPGPGRVSTPDGNWWATVGSIADETDCLDASVPICLAKATRPWRAIWYIEPPPDPSVLTPTGQVPASHPRTPTDVRICYYSDSDTSPFLGDDHIEQDLGSSDYQVAVRRDPDHRAMMHTLLGMSTSNPSAVGTWLTSWLYGTGAVKSRHLGQDQVNPDRYCWYQWYQAQNDTDGFGGILAVEWLTTVYIGVPSEPFNYCQGGVYGTHDGYNPNRTQGNLDGGSYECVYNTNRNPDAAIEYWKAVAKDWNLPGDPSATLTWLGDPVDRFSTCRVGSRWLDDTPQSYDWFLQTATIIVENEQETGLYGREPMHPLGTPNDGRTIRSPSTPPSTLSANWWQSTSSTGVGAPQTGTALAHNNMHRRYLAHVAALTYPTSLSDTGGHDDCDRVPLTVKSLPCRTWHSGACSTKDWWGMFNYQVDSAGQPVLDSQGKLQPSPTPSPNSNLWAWWSQQVSELRAQITPVPIDP